MISMAILGQELASCKKFWFCVPLGAGSPPAASDSLSEAASSDESTPAAHQSPKRPKRRPKQPTTSLIVLCGAWKTLRLLVRLHLPISIA